MTRPVPTHTDSVTVPCPGWTDTTECRAPLEVELEITGRHVRESYWHPGEGPEISVLAEPTGCAVCGTAFDRVDRERIREQAEREVANVA